MKLTVEFGREVDGRVIAEVLELPGLMAYGATEAEALDNAVTLVREHFADSKIRRTVYFDVRKSQDEEES